MNIHLSPQRRDDNISVEVRGDLIIVNGSGFDFSPLAEGSTVKADDVPCEFIVGAVARKDGEIELTLILPHGSNPSEAVAFPATIYVEADGVVSLPFDPLPVDLEDFANVDA